jgi:hypothetical protein
MMRYLHIPKGVGYWALIYFNIGLLGLLSSSAFFILNIVFSALGAVEWGGGIVVFDYTSVNFPSITIESGGRIGLFMGILAGILASFTEGRFWVVNSENEKDETSIEKKGLLFLIGVTFILYDIFSSYFALNGGVWFTNPIDSLFSLGVTLILFSVGPEMLMVFFFEMMMENSKEGWPKTTELIKLTILGVFGFFGDLMNGGKQDKKKNFPKANPLPTQSHVVGKTSRGRGRPPKEQSDIARFMDNYERDEYNS